MSKIDHRDGKAQVTFRFVGLSPELDADLEALLKAAADANSKDVAAAATSIFVRAVLAALPATTPIAGPVAAATGVAFGNAFARWMNDNPNARLRAAVVQHESEERRRHALGEFAAVVRHAVSATISHLERDVSQLVEQEQSSANFEAIGELVRGVEQRLFEGLTEIKTFQKERWTESARLIDRFPKPIEAAQLLRIYRQSTRLQHSRPTGLFAEQLSELDTIYVELELGIEHRSAGGQEGITLRKLMESKPSDDHNPTASLLLTLSERDPSEQPVIKTQQRMAPRWVVFGDPGAGKSTLARHLVWEFAGRADDSAPLPVYCWLPALALEQAHPFDHTETQLKAVAGSAIGRGFSETLFERASSTSVWLLLDGLDEVVAERRQWVHSQLAQWADHLPSVTIAVFTRPVGYTPLGINYANRARIKPLLAEQQRSLLFRWLGNTPAASHLFEAVQASPGMREFESDAGASR